MTKYYYSCPLSAAYMAKNFGMRFLLEGEEFDEWGAEIRDLWPDFGEDTAIKYHIHPDSLHLLEPRPGDLVICDDKYRHIWAATGVPLDWGSLKNLRGNDQYLEIPRFLEDRELKRIRKDGITKIIQRQKMPFHWPEKENENG